jgi:hypothetical protein
MEFHIIWSIYKYVPPHVSVFSVRIITNHSPSYKDQWTTSGLEAWTDIYSGRHSIFTRTTKNDNKSIRYLPDHVWFEKEQSRRGISRSIRHDRCAETAASKSLVNLERQNGCGVCSSWIIWSVWTSLTLPASSLWL